MAAGRDWISSEGKNPSKGLFVKKTQALRHRSLDTSREISARADPEPVLLHQHPCQQQDQWPDWGTLLQGTGILTDGCQSQPNLCFPDIACQQCPPAVFPT